MQKHPLEIPSAITRILKISNCPSMSGRSELTYHLGCNAEGDIHLRVVANTGGGQFNANWVLLNDILALLAEHPKEKPMSATVLRPLYRHRSSNSPAFLFAVLLAESVVQPEKVLGYQPGNVEAVKSALSVLVASETNLNAVVALPEGDTSASVAPSSKPKRTVKA